MTTTANIITNNELKSKCYAILEDSYQDFIDWQSGMSARLDRNRHDEEFCEMVESRSDELLERFRAQCYFTARLLGTTTGDVMVEVTGF